jgi:hypothetical protein
MPRLVEKTPVLQNPIVSRRVAVLGGVAALASTACGPGITIVSSVRPPDAEPLNMKGEKMAAVVMMQDQTKRRAAEDALARAITKHGARGIAMYTILPSPNPADEGAARAAIEAAGIKGLVVMHPERVRKTEVTPAQTYSLPMYTGYWGGYYPYGWGTAWGAPSMPIGVYARPEGQVHGGDMAPYYTSGPATVDVPASEEKVTVVRVTILVYSLKQNRLVWAGVTDTTDPGKVDSFVMDLAEITAEQLRDVRLIPG